jgi:hypothetical protein
MPKPPFLRRSRPNRYAIQVRAGNTVIVQESSEFDKDSSAALTGKQKERLITSLANNPLQGDLVPNFPELLQVKFEGHTVIYGTSPDFRKVNLVMFVTDGGDGPEGPDDGSNGGRAKEALGTLIKGGIFGVGKKLGEHLWENILNHWLNFIPLHKDLRELLSRLRLA